MSQGKSCARCGLPEDMPGITLQDGLCSYCRGEKPAPNHYEPLGVERLRRYCYAMLTAHPAGEYQAVVAFSGGRDSTYMLYKVCRELELKTLAVAVVSDFVPEATRGNITRIAARLGADLRVVENRQLNRCARSCVSAWAAKPEAGAAMLATFCTGCRLTVTETIPKIARQVGAPLMFTGHTPHEFASYKTDILSLDPDHPSAKGKLLGYAKQMAANPRYLLHPEAVFTQGREFLGFNKYKADSLPVILKPFVNYLPWDEKEMERILAELEYDRGQFAGTRRSDCFIAPLRQYLYWKQLGFCDAHCYYSYLVREGRLTLAEAQAKIDRETDFDRDFIAEIMASFGVDLAQVEARLPRRPAVRRPAPQPGEKPAERFVEEAAQSAEPQIEQPAAISPEQPGEKPAERFVEKAAQSAKPQTEQPAALSPEQPGEKPAEQPAEEGAFRPALSRSVAGLPAAAAMACSASVASIKPVAPSSAAAAMEASPATDPRPDGCQPEAGAVPELGLSEDDVIGLTSVRANDSISFTERGVLPAGEYLSDGDMLAAMEYPAEEEPLAPSPLPQNQPVPTAFPQEEPASADLSQELSAPSSSRQPTPAAKKAPASWPEQAKAGGKAALAGTAAAWAAARRRGAALCHQLSPQLKAAATWTKQAGQQGATWAVAAGKTVARHTAAAARAVAGQAGPLGKRCRQIARHLLQEGGKLVGKLKVWAVRFGHSCCRLAKEGATLSSQWLSRTWAALSNKTRRITEDEALARRVEEGNSAKDAVLRAWDTTRQDRENDIKNQFRPDPTAQLSHQLHLDETELDDTEFDEAELDDTELDDTELDEAELDEAELDEAELDEAELDDTELDEAELGEAELDAIEFDETESDEAEFNETKLDQAEPIKE